MMNKKYTYLIVIFLTVASFIAYGRILGNGFVNYDDARYITNNIHVQSGINFESIKWAFTTSHIGYWHPLTFLSHMLDWYIFRDHAGGHHLISLMFHIGNVLLLFFFLNKTTGSLWPSAFAAALFALHPLRVESVAWAAERKDVLSAFFGLSSLYVYALYAEKPQASKYIFCLLLFALGLLAKPMLVTLPFVLLLLDYWPLGRWQKAINPLKVQTFNDIEAVRKKGKPRKVISTIEKKRINPVKNSGQLIGHLLWEKAPFFFLAIISSIITIWAQHNLDGISSLQKLPFAERAANTILAYVFYLLKIFWPVNLAVLYPYDHSFELWKVIGSFLVLLGISAGVIYQVRKAPFFLVGWLWYLGTLVPVIGLIQVGAQSIADRYTYLPSIGIGIMLAWGIGSLIKQEEVCRKILFPIGIIALLVLAVLTWQQCGHWKNSITLFNHTLQVTKDNYVAHTNLGGALAEEGKIEQAIVHYRVALQIKPNDDSAHYNLANAFQKQGKINDAIFHYRETLKANPNHSKAHNNLGVYLDAQGLHDEAIAHYRQALQIEPANPGFHFNLGMALGRKDDLKEAIESFRTAIYLNPDYEEARRALRLALDIQQRQKR